MPEDPMSIPANGAGEALDTAAHAGESLASTLSDTFAATKKYAKESAEAARDWASRQAAIAKQTASDKPVLTVSLSAATALAAGLVLGFVLGRAMADHD